MSEFGSYDHLIEHNMPQEIVPPFSVRNQSANKQIDQDLPETVRIGLVHILYSAVGQHYVAGWPEIAIELQRIARESPVEYSSTNATHIKNAKSSAEYHIETLPWEKILDFCERLYNHLTQEFTFIDSFGNSEVVIPYHESQEWVAKELQYLFLEENLAFEFKNGSVLRRGRRHNIDNISRGATALGDPRLEIARRHYNKALQYFRNPANPDYENAVKEAVCAVEAAAKTLFPGPNHKTLGDVVKSITGNEVGKLPKTIAQTIHGLYGFRSSGEGIGHGGTSGGSATASIAEYALVVAASQVILLIDLGNEQENDLPF